MYKEISNAPMGLKRLRSTALAQEEETMYMAFCFFSQ